MIYKGLSSFKDLSTSEILLFLLNPLSSSDEITDLKYSRLRQFGGTSNQWGGWSKPMEELPILIQVTRYQ